MKKQRFYYCHFENKNMEKLVMVSGEKNIRSIAFTPQHTTKMYQIGTILFNMIEFLSEHMNELQGRVSKLAIEKMVREHAVEYNQSEVYVECIKNSLYSIPREGPARKVFYDRIKNYFSFIENCPYEKQQCNLDSLLLFNSKFGESLISGEKAIFYPEIDINYHVLSEKEMLEFLRSKDKAKNDYDKNYIKYAKAIKEAGLGEFLKDKNDVNISTYYKIDTIVDLIIASSQAIFVSKNTIQVCKNCNRFFVPINKRNTKYCNNPDRTNFQNKTCRQIMACYRNTKVYSKDTVTKNYIRLKNKLKNRAEFPGQNISPEAQVKRKKIYKNFKEECSGWVKKIKREECTKEQYLEWLKKQEKETKKLPK